MELFFEKCKSLPLFCEGGGSARKKGYLHRGIPSMVGESAGLQQRFDHFEGGFVIGFMGDFRDIFDVADHPFGIDDDNPATQ